MKRKRQAYLTFMADLFWLAMTGIYLCLFWVYIVYTVHKTFFEGSLFE